MKTKRVNRYYCDFCKKSGCSAGHMKKHESRCTLNPNRECGVCRLGNQWRRPVPMTELLAILPDVVAFNGDPTCIDEIATGKAVAAVLPKLRAATANCPACIFAALRQKGIPPSIVPGFDFQQEMNDLLRTQRNERNE